MAYTKDNTRRPLTDREVEIFEMLSHGLTHDIVAEKFEISKRTSEAHALHICRKLQACNMAHAVRLGFKYKILSK